MALGITGWYAGEKIGQVEFLLQIYLLRVWRYDLQWHQSYSDATVSPPSKIPDTPPPDTNGMMVLSVTIASVKSRWCDIIRNRTLAFTNVADRFELYIQFTIGCHA